MERGIFSSPAKSFTAAVSQYIAADEVRVRRTLGMAALAIDQAAGYASVHDADHGPLPPLERYLLGRSLRGWVTWQLTQETIPSANDADATLRRVLIENSLDQVDWDLVAQDVLTQFGRSARGQRGRAA